MKVIINISVR